MRDPRRLLHSVTPRGRAAAADSEAAPDTTLLQRSLSVPELQAAVIALRRGDFAHYGLALPPAPPSAVPATPATPVTPASPAATRPVQPVSGPAVLVLSAHPGSGASTVAAAVAEGFCARGHRTRLIDCADPARSGLAAATTVELGVHADGWRRGRRDEVPVDRLAWPAGHVDDLPYPVGGTDHPSEVLLVDAGRPAADVLACSGWIGGLAAAAELLVVCRASVPGVYHAAALLQSLDRPAVVAAVGAARLPGVVAAGLSPVLRAARDRGRLVGVPADRRLQISGLTADPLPKPIAGAGRRLAALLYPDQPELAGMAFTSHRKATS